jgi:hypothetical protein
MRSVPWYDIEGQLELGLPEKVLEAGVRPDRFIKSGGKLHVEKDCPDNEGKKPATMEDIKQANLATWCVRCDSDLELCIAPWLVDTLGSSSWFTNAIHELESELANPWSPMDSVNNASMARSHGVKLMNQVSDVDANVWLGKYLETTNKLLNTTLNMALSQSNPVGRAAHTQANSMIHDTDISAGLLLFVRGSEARDAVIDVLFDMEKTWITTGNTDLARKGAREQLMNTDWAVMLKKLPTLEELRESVDEAIALWENRYLEPLNELMLVHTGAGDYLGTLQEFLPTQTLVVSEGTRSTAIIPAELVPSNLLPQPIPVEPGALLDLKAREGLESRLRVIHGLAFQSRIELLDGWETSEDILRKPKVRTGVKRERPSIER